MKDRIKREHLFLYIGLLCFLGLSYFHDVYRILSFSAFFIAVMALYLIRNKYVAYGVSALIMVVFSFFRIKHAIHMLPVYLLIVLYKNMIKKIRIANDKKAKKSGISHTGLHFLILLGFAEIIYAIVSFFENDYYASYENAGELVVVSVTIAAIFLIGAFSKKVAREVRHVYKVSNENYITLNIINFTSVFLLCSTVLLNYGAYQNFEANHTIVCFPWCIWLCVLVYEKNPLTEAILKMIEEKIKEISERRIVEK